MVTLGGPDLNNKVLHGIAIFNSFQNFSIYFNFEKILKTYMTGLLHEGKSHVGDLLEPAIFDSLPWAYVMCNCAQI